MNDLTLEASSLPLNAFGDSITSRTQGFVAMPAGSQGNLCLAGSIGRDVGPGQILDSGASGAFSLALDLSAIPQPMTSVAALLGDTWNLQAWTRDSVGGVATSDFTDAVAIDFD